MRRTTSTLVISALALTLASCASVPSQNDLMAGIDKTQLAPGTAKTRTPGDPVCVDFYSNVAEFRRKAQSPSSTSKFFKSLGANVASAVVVSQVIPSGISPTSRAAVSAAASTATTAGREIALEELNSSDRADAKIIDVAEEIGCPVNIAP